MSERMTDAQLDRQIREFLAWHSDDLAGVPSASEMTARVRERVRPAGHALAGDYQQRLVLALLLAALLALLIGTAAFVGGYLPQPMRTVQNGWIAFSTQPGYKQVSETDRTAGGDIYLVREGIEPRLIVARGPDNNHNVCPQFSPEGSRLAYGQLAGQAAAIVVLEVGANGAVSEWRRLALPGPAGLAPCPRWTRNGTHLAYLDGVRWDAYGNLASPGTDVRVVDLHGAFAEPTPDDPSVEGLRQSGTFEPFESPDGDLPLLSPDGQLRASCTDDGLVIGPPDGSAGRVASRWCGHSLAAWSPDGSKVLLLSQLNTNANLAVVLVVGPPEEEYLANVISLNGSRSMPGRGDISWQAIYP